MPSALRNPLSRIHLREDAIYAIFLGPDRLLVQRTRVPNTIDRQQLGQKIREIREARDLSQPKLSELSGIPQGTISNWETGATEPKATQIPVLAAALGVPVGELLCQAEDPMRAPLPETDRRRLAKLIQEMRRIVTRRRR